MTEQWQGRETDHQVEERVRVCPHHRRICAEDTKRDRIVCPVGHVVAGDDFDVMTRSKAEALEAPRRRKVMARGVAGSGSGGQRVKTVESQGFRDGAGSALRVVLRVRGRRYEVFISHLSADRKSRKGGVLESFLAEQAARGRFDAEVGRARAKGWQPGNTRSAGLTEIPEPQPEKTKVRGGGASERESRLTCVGGTRA